MSGFKVTAELQGVSACIAKLKDIDKKVRKRVVKKAVNAGATELVRAVKQTAPRQTGLLRRKATKKIKAYNGKVLAIIGAKRFKDPSTGRNPANYAHLVEDGAKPHVINGAVFRGKDGIVRQMVVHHPGAPAQRFMRRAARSADSAALRRFKSKLVSELAIETK